jgi:cytochrome c oxidase subunit II
MSNACVVCHAIQGTRAQATVGPDLTHLGSRRTLGAGVLINNAGTLAGWILDPQPVKPGNFMPPTNLEPDDLLALVEYLLSLE